MKFKSSAFQYAQNIPIDSFPAPDEQIKATGTDAFMLLTVYPRPDPWNISDTHLNALVEQCRRLNVDEKRRLLIRIGPEMNGNWNYWGQQPIKFKQLWIRMARAIRANCPLTGLVWAPNTSEGYPFPLDARPVVANTNELRAMDTNNDGVVTAADDPYEPYYPGDEWVDWVGMSIYHYGINYPWLDNSIAEPGKFERLLNLGNFYQRYSVAKRKPMQIAEGAGTFHTNTTRGVGAGEVNVKRSFWRQWLTNRTFLETHPEIKMFNLFEFRKDEELTNRDFRISWDNQVLNAFLEDLEPVKDMYLFANTTGPENRNNISISVAPNNTNNNSNNNNKSGDSAMFSVRPSSVALAFFILAFSLY
jgi:hypothetical protein